jgi:hypothetical protein
VRDVRGKPTGNGTRDTTHDQERHIDPSRVGLPQPSSPKNYDEDDDASDEDRDDQHKAEDFFLQRGHARLGVRGKLRDTTKDSVIASRNTNTQTTATNAVRALEANVVRLEVVLFGALDCGGDGFRFTCGALLIDKIVKGGVDVFLPVKMERSNIASLETSTRRTSAGSLLPCLTTIMSPGTRSSADILTCEPLRITMHASGSIVPIDDMTLLVLQSCHALKAAWMSQTASNTQARAKLATAGG